jgi:hypothetical protein
LRPCYQRVYGRIGHRSRTTAPGLVRAWHLPVSYHPCPTTGKHLGRK